MDNCGDTFLINLYKFQNGTNPCKNHYVIIGLGASVNEYL